MNKFTLKILWGKRNIGLAIDHIIQKNYSPLTSYFFWPRNNAWAQIKTELDSKPWVSEKSKIDLLNKISRIINYWQENVKIKSSQDAQNKFPEFIFYGEQ